MTAILRNLPSFDRPSVVRMRGVAVRVKAHQIVVWVSLTPPSNVGLEPGCPHFPAILDTGNTTTFSLKEWHLRQWGGVDPRFLPRLGSARHGGRVVPTHAARVWLHRGRPGERDVVGDLPSHRLDLQEGVLIYRDDAPLAPRLPLLGLRALEENRLHLKVDAEHRRMSLRTPDWVTRLCGWW